MDGLTDDQICSMCNDPSSSVTVHRLESSVDAYRSNFFWTRNNGGAVLAVGETRPAADFYVYADLTRPSERRLQAGNF